MEHDLSRKNIKTMKYIFGKDCKWTKKEMLYLEQVRKIKRKYDLTVQISLN